MCGDEGLVTRPMAAQQLIEQTTAVRMYRKRRHRRRCRRTICRRQTFSTTSVTT